MLIKNMRKKGSSNFLGAEGGGGRPDLPPTLG